MINEWYEHDAETPKYYLSSDYRYVAVDPHYTFFSEQCKLSYGMVPALFIFDRNPLITSGICVNIQNKASSDINRRE